MALRQVKITVDQPLIPEDQDIQHTGTSYQISKDKDFSIEENILVESLNNTENLTTFYAELDIDYDSIIFVRSKYHFDVGGLQKESNWSRIVPVNSLQSGIKLSSSVVKTPNITVSEDEDLVVIKTSDFSMYTGPGDHLSSDYVIEDTDGEVIFQRENDKDNLTSIYIRNKLETGKIYNVMSRHTNTTNNSSNFGKRLFSFYSPNLNLFEFEHPEDFVINRKFYYRLKIWVSLFKSYSLEIRDENENVIMSINDDTRTTNFIMLDDSRFVPHNIYTINVKLNFTNGTSTDYKVVFQGPLLENSVIPYDSNVTYADKYSLAGTRETGGITCFTMRETFDNKFIGPSKDGRCLYLYKFDNNGEFVELAELYEFNGNIDVDYLNIIQLSNHDILVDVLLYNEKRQAKVMFLRFEYDPIRLKLVLLKQLVREDERFNTSVSNSFVINGKGQCYYIPARMVDKQGNLDWLRLRKLNLEELTIEDIKLPYDVKYFANIVMDKNGEFYVFGGSWYNKYEKDENNMNVEYWENNAVDVFKLDTVNNSFSLWCSLPEHWPKELYCIQPILRVDGRIILHNACWSGAGLSYNKFITFDPTIRTFNFTDINGPINVPVRTNIIFKNGDIYRFTSKVEDPQNVLVYHSNSKRAEDIDDFDSIDKEPLELIVNEDEVKAIEDIYKYTKITILGNGKLKWYRPQGITVLTSKDLIVMKNTRIRQLDLARQEYRSILVLDGVDFQIVTGRQTQEDEEAQA